MINAKGLDVSHWNTVKWLIWKEQGYVFCWIKVSERTDWVDPKWMLHYDDSSQQSFFKGPYHYFRVEYNGALQAQHFYTECQKRAWDLPPMVDVEKRNNAGLVSKAVFAARLRNFLFECERLFGVKPIIYTSLDSWSTLVGSAVWSTAYDLWVAHYTANPVPLIPNDWKAKGWKIWQYTSTPLDQNRFNGDENALREWAKIGSPALSLKERLAKLEVWARTLGYEN